MRSTLWYVMWPGAVYAEGPWRLTNEKTERQFRAHVREVMKMDRLPAGTEVWPTTDAQVRDVGNSNRPPDDRRRR